MSHVLHLQGALGTPAVSAGGMLTAGQIHTCRVQAGSGTEQRGAQGAQVESFPGRILGQGAADQLMDEFSAYPRAGATWSRMCADHRDGRRDHGLPEGPLTPHAHPWRRAATGGRGTCDREDSPQFFLGGGV